MNKKILIIIFFLFLLLPAFGQCVSYTASISSTNSSCNIISPGAIKLKVTISGGVSPFTVVYRNEITNVQTTVLNYTSNSDIVINDVLTQTTPFTLVSVTASNSCPATLQNPNTSVLFYKVPAVPTANITNASCPNDSNGSIAITNQFYPSSLLFNGVKTTTAATPADPHVDLGGRLLSNRSRFSAEGWIKFDKTKYRNRMSLFGQNDVVEFGFEGDNLLCYTAGGGTVTSPLANYPSDNAWHHIAAVGNGTSLKLYVDGNEVGSVNRTTSNYGNNTTYSTKIGWGVLDVGGIGFIGEISNVGFWSRALSIDEIKGLASGFTLYNSKQVGLLAGYNFTEGSGTTVAPISSTTPAPSNGVFNGVTLPLWVDQSTYNWTSSVAGFTPSTSKSLTGLKPGVYNLNITVNQGCSRTTPFTVGATNNVTTPLIGVITKPNCITSTGGVRLTGLPSGSWTLIRTGSSGLSINGSGSETTISGLAPGTYQFAVASGGCTSLPTGNVIIDPVTTTTYTASGWSVTPTIDMLGVINSNIPITTNVELCNCTVNATDAVVAFGKTLKLRDKLTVNGSLTFENTANLVQENNVVNTGNIKYQRETTPIKKFDFTYWSSPVSGQKLFDLSPLTNPGKYYSFNSSTGAYAAENPQNLMGKGIGYIIRAPENTATPPAPLSPYLAIFEGVPHNGTITLSPVLPFKAYLIGNPYPSALDADAFIAANANVLFGTLYFWTHNTARGVGVNNPGSGYYAYSADDYATYNTTGGVAVAASDSNKDISNPYRPTGKIAAGQAFFASTIENMIGTSILFNNSMRLGVGNTILDNSQFFKTTSSKSKTASSVERHRLWLNLTNAQGAFKQMLVGYISGATNNYDTTFDGTSYNGNKFLDFYSVNNNKMLTIQGRALPFEESDEVQLGYSSTIQGSFSISIDKVDGVLASRKIYLEDKIKNITHDLKQGPYTFETATGTFNTRFVLRYTDKTLGVDDIDLKKKSVVVSVKNKLIKVESGAESIDKIFVYTLSGAVVYEKQKVDAAIFTIPSLSVAQQVLIVKTVLQDGSVTTTKIIY
ncbi:MULTISPECIES: LamG-like jellyroll fold domain-containing protein [unclassified Flavobacterium]|uniref:LamG-like jellyroll fold domain-containing protein n=1 Tax=unclassified Flavobacterium TaxID=196869 RepID=UPI00131AEA0A|nr:MULTISPECIES: LamG-like jellyroll fold domain-containing protein [unclassified Flavobacterium]